MAVTSLKTRPIFVWIPPSFHPIHKIEVERSNGAIDDVTDFILEGELFDGATEGVGTFTFTIDNSNDSLKNVWTGNEKVFFYSDYATTATTKRFTGLIEKVAYTPNKVTISGRNEGGLRLLNLTATKEFISTTGSTIVKDVLSAYDSDITTTNVSTTTNSLTIKWSHKSAWEAIVQIARASGFDVYIDQDLDCNFFQEGSRLNSSEAVVHDDNIIEVGEFGNDITLVRNRIIVYGADVEDLPLVYTAEDSASQTKYKVREEQITDTNLTTFSQVRERAEFELANKKDPPKVSDITSFGLPSIRPGEKVLVTHPDSGIAPAHYKIISFTHTFSSDSLFTTTIRIQKESPLVSQILKERVLAEQELSDITNPHELRFSYNLTFEDETDTDTHNKTEVDQSRLKLTSGNTSGSFLSKARSHSVDITSVQLKITGESLPGTDYFVSVNNGATFFQVTKDSLVSVDPANTGTSLVIKIEINSSATQIESIAVLYK